MLFLDAAYTIIHPAERVGQAYSRHLATSTGIAIASEVMHASFRQVFEATPPPNYSLHPFGHAAERAWWSELVAAVLTQLGGAAAEFASSRLSPCDLPTFDSFFDSLYGHFSTPAAWSLYPDTVEFLEAASKLGPLAVVSNFDDRLAPILDGLGIGPCFEHIFTSADARARKPDRAIFDLALARLNCAPTETFHCGDNYEADYQGATAVGLRAFHLKRPQHTLFDFLDFCRA
jgi:putative hydrolase of the HAD superfamily